MLDGDTFICIARTVSKRIGDYSSPETFSIGIGFDIKYADRCIYSDVLDLNKPVPTGLSVEHVKEKIADKEHSHQSIEL